MENVLTREQVDKLIVWKSTLQFPRIVDRKERADKAEDAIHKIIETSDFAKGTNLSPENIDKIFHLMRNFSRNRALSNLEAFIKG